MRPSVFGFLLPSWDRIALGCQHQPSTDLAVVGRKRVGQGIGVLCLALSFFLSKKEGGGPRETLHSLYHMKTQQDDVLGELENGY